MNDLMHRTGAVLIGWTRVGPATREPWSYEHQDPPTSTAEREGINRLQAVER